MPTSPWRPRQAVTSPLAQIPLRRLPRNFPGWEVSGSRRNGIWAKGDVTACRGRHGEVGIVDWALLCFGFLWQICYVSVILPEWEWMIQCTFGRLPTVYVLTLILQWYWMRELTCLLNFSGKVQKLLKCKPYLSYIMYVKVLMLTIQY